MAVMTKQYAAGMPAPANAANFAGHPDRVRTVASGRRRQTLASGCELKRWRGYKATGHRRKTCKDTPVASPSPLLLDGQTPPAAVMTNSTLLECQQHRSMPQNFGT